VLTVKFRKQNKTLKSFGVDVCL